MRKSAAHMKGVPQEQARAVQALREDPADWHVDTAGFDLSRALQLAPGTGTGLEPGRG